MEGLSIDDKYEIEEFRDIMKNFADAATQGDLEQVETILETGDWRQFNVEFKGEAWAVHRGRDQLTRGKVDREVCTFVTDVLVARATREISEKGFRLKILKGYLLSYQLRDNRH